MLLRLLFLYSDLGRGWLLGSQHYCSSPARPPRQISWVQVGRRVGRGSGAGLGFGVGVGLWLPVAACGPWYCKHGDKLPSIPRSGRDGGGRRRARPDPAQPAGSTRTGVGGRGAALPRALDPAPSASIPGLFEDAASAMQMRTSGNRPALHLFNCRRRGVGVGASGLSAQASTHCSTAWRGVAWRGVFLKRHGPRRAARTPVTTRRSNAKRQNNGASRVTPIT